LASVARVANIYLADAVTNEDYMPKLYLKLAIALSASGTAIFLFRLIGMISAGNLGSSGSFSYGAIGVELMKVAGCIAVLVIAARHLMRSPQRGSPFDEL
jgi:hypothetical protein